MKKIFILTALSCCVAACSIAETSEPETPSSFATLVATIEDDCKTYLEKPDVKWQNGDAICVIDIKSHRYEPFYLSSGAGTTSGTFEGVEALKTDPTEFYALYPYGENHTKQNSGYYYFDYPKTQNYSKNSFGKGANPMIATFTSASDPLKFKNIFGLLKLQLTGNAMIKKIEVTNNNSEDNLLWGRVSLYCGDGKQGTGGQTLGIAKKDGQGDNTVVLDLGDGEMLTKTQKDFHIVLRPGALKDGMTVKIYNMDENEFKSFTTTKNNEIIRSEIRKMPVKDIIFEDLSSCGYTAANCYILYVSGQYKFKAVKGNGTTALAVTDVEVLWETVNTATAPAVGAVVMNPSYANGYITFTATGTPGNALIAAKNGDDIVWSWHIWVPSSIICDHSYVTNDGTKELMDRNLGALVATAGNPLSNGLLYQFGRKDPFMGLADYGTSNKAGSSGTFYSETAESGKGMDYAIAHPTTFIKNSTTPQDWQDGGSGNNWGDTNKTIYDPCPYGYTVANKSVWNNNFENFGYTAENFYYSYSIIGFYPSNIYCYASDGNLHYNDGYGRNGYIWTRNNGINQSYYLALKTTKTEKGNYAELKTIARAAGLGVRCQKME